MIPIVLAGNTPSSTKYVQFWGDVTVAPITRKECLASLVSSERGVRMLLHEELPEEWLPQVLEAYTKLRAGELIRGTHTVTWSFSVPTFTEVG